MTPFTKYSTIVKAANKLILVFLDNNHTYNRKKDLMAVGAAIQNILLTAHSLGLGSCWLGEILNQEDKIKRKLKLTSNLELAAVIALGKPKGVSKSPGRKKLKELIV